MIVATPSRRSSTLTNSIRVNVCLLWLLVATQMFLSSLAAQDKQKANHLKVTADYIHIAKLCLEKSKFYDAIQAYEKARQTLPKNTDMNSSDLNDLAIAQLSIGRDEDADKTMKTILHDKGNETPEKERLNSLIKEYKHSASHIEEGAKLLEVKDTRAAITEYEEATEHMPYNAEFHLLLAYAYKARYRQTRDAADWSRAQREFNAVRRFDPDEYQKIKEDDLRP